MHKGAREYVAAVAGIIPAGLAILEIGSRDVNGTVRDLFASASSYLGIDIAGGPGVNLILDAGRIDELGLSFDVVISCEMLEHARDPEQVCEAAYNVLKPGGMFVITAANDKREPHSALDGGPLRDGEHYQPITRAMLAHRSGNDAALLDRFRSVVIREEMEHGDIYALAVK